MENLKKCPKCGKLYKPPGALSRSDNVTEVCPACGMTEAMKAAEAAAAEQWHGGDAEESYFRKMAKIYSDGGSPETPEAFHSIKDRILEMYAQAVAHFADKVQAAISPYRQSDAVFIAGALKMLYDGTLSILDERDRSALEAFQTMAKFKIAVIASEDRSYDREKALALFKAGKIGELEAQGVSVATTESGGLAQAKKHPEADGLTEARVVVDLRSDDAPKQITELSKLIYGIARNAEPAIMHGALVAAQTKATADHPFDESVVEQLRSDLTQYYKDYEHGIPEDLWKSAVKSLCD